MKHTIIAAQINTLVGDIEGNTQKIIEKLATLSQKTAPLLIVFPELCMTGYPPEDLLLRPHLYTRCEHALLALKHATKKTETAIIIGYPERNGANCYNKAACIYKGEIIAERIKEYLPNYTVFDEKRYFNSIDNVCVFALGKLNIGLIICEDFWFETPAQNAKKKGAELLVVINASPYDQHKLEKRQSIALQRVAEVKLPLIYVNCVGGQDELVFDGNSFALNQDGTLAAMAACCEEQDFALEMTIDPFLKFVPQPLPPFLSLEETIYRVLVLGVRDYIEKNNFPGVIIGLSGGIDSALTLAIAVDALGAHRVLGVLMPSRYTAEISNEDAIAQATALSVNYKIINIEPMFTAFLHELAPSFQNTPENATEENIQARIRGTILMALSNKFGAMVLTTGNKSELSVGYATLYGDMAGGFSVLKDIPKTLVYQLARYRNTQKAVIPERVFSRAPSAELSENQTDQDTLPDYETLDAIIDWYIDKELDAPAIIKKGFNSRVVTDVIRMINRNEYKRRQAAPGIRISERAFGKDRRYPITSGYYRTT